VEPEVWQCQHKLKTTVAHGLSVHVSQQTRCSTRLCWMEIS
jgi:hypothetical protein